MGLSNAMYRMFDCVWGLKDRDYAPFLVTSAQNELALDRAGLDRLALERFRGMLRHAEENSRYYARVFRECKVTADDLTSLADAPKFPCLTRDALRGQLLEIIPGGMVSPAWRRSATGGTTSSPVAFYCDHPALWRKNACAKAFDQWYGRKTGDRSAFLWGAPQDLPGRPTLGMMLRDLTRQRSIMLPSAPLDNRILSDHYRKLSQWRPTFLQAYPTPLYEFCLFLRENGLRLPFLQAVSVTAEALAPAHRQVIEENLGLKVYNWYGSRELGRIASECACHDGLHINETSVHLEIEPDPALPEGSGHLIITDLLNRATPLIRYRTGDIARFVEGPCGCGRVLRRIAAIEGRLTDLIVLPGGRKVPGVSLTNRVVKDFLEISELQIVQRTLTSFLVRFVRGPDFNPASLEAFSRSFFTLLDLRVDISFEEVAQIPRERSGKVRFVISDVSSQLS
jgi:phenylacetate-CoA ligase